MEADALKLFAEIDEHISNDKIPSVYFQEIDNPLFRLKSPFVMLERLKEIKQSPQYHPEGSVWNHTMLVIDEAAMRKEQSNDEHVFMWAALLHDIGKADTTKVRNGKITSYNHDNVGAELTWEFLGGFCDASFAAHVSALVRFHMHILYVIKSMRFADIDAMIRDVNVDDVALLGLCDRLGRKGANLHEEEKNVLEFLRKVDEKMKNNKNRMRDREKTNADLRKMNPKENADKGIVNGKHLGTHDGGHEKDGRGQ